MAERSEGWRFWIDRGGTFTDIVARDAAGVLHVEKLLSRGEDDDTVLAGIRRCLGLETGAAIPPGAIHSVRAGTTVATNALLERKGAPTLLVTTAGFEDQFEIGTQARPDIFAKRIIKPGLLHARVAGARERVRADGVVERPLDAERLRSDLEQARSDGLTAVAVVFMHAYAFPEHERQAARLARELGFAQVSASHEVSPLVKLVNRGDTTVVDAYLSPVLRQYVDAVSARLGVSWTSPPEGFSTDPLPLAGRARAGGTPTSDAWESPPPNLPRKGGGALSSEQGPRLLFMASSGGLKPAAMFRGRDAILSGPAGGVVAMAETGRRAGFEKVIGFDMGGTSTDVSHYAGAMERTFETEVAGVRLAVPMLRVNTIAAGGGSILAFDGARFRAGPESAGSDPGPKSYRRGGPLTITDANVMTGKLVPELFPAIFGPKGDQPLDRDGVAEAFRVLARDIGDGRAPEEVADGFIRVAVEAMANAIKRISVARGYDVTEYTLNCFGSAGGQHACLIADALGMRTILVTPFSGVLSAYGMGLARLRASRERSVDAPLTLDGVGSLGDLMRDLSDAVLTELKAQGVAEADINLSTLLHVRYAGTDSALAVPFGEVETMAGDFTAQHQRRFGFQSPEKPIVIAAIEVEAVEACSPLPWGEAGAEPGEAPGEGCRSVRSAVPPHPAPASPELASPRRGEARDARFYSQGAWHDARVHRRTALGTGQTLDGPALVIEPHQTVVVEPDWRLAVTPEDTLILTRVSPRSRQRLGTKADPVLLEVFNNRFTAVAEEMGEALRLTAQSVNIKERLDFSCAIFDAGGALVANAPHVPVHLGSMDRSVEAVMRAFEGRMKPGDVYMLNAPYDGGTHLPDITVVTPVVDERGGNIRYYVASRGHHADIGGIAPGSMSPLARTIEEEGIYIDAAPLVEAGRFREAETLALLTNARYPARNPSQNIADLKAQVAANARGAAELSRLDREYGHEVVAAYMGHVQANAEESVRRLIAGLSDGHFRVETDQGFAVEARVTADRAARRMTIDFTGTSPQQPSNFNAPEPVARAAVLYVIRVLLGEPIPLNAGCLRPIDIIIPDGSLLKPSYPAAVAAGNVETSQIVTNCLFAAFGALGSAQGTMNNLTFGNDRVQYYETICSGAPAGPGFDGAAGVHVHMTNTRLTDPEVLEQRFPVVVEEFSIRRGSGGRGRWVSGDGTRRVIRFLQRMECAILSGYRRVRPFGLAGGAPGETGRNSIRRADGGVEPLDGCARAVLEPGDAIIIETPTGGGVGE